MKASELVYMILDLAKANTSDDAYYTEDHILFLCKKFRAFLIKKEQEKNKGMEDEASEFEMQQICLNLEPVAAIDGEPCTGGYYLRTVEEIPKLLEGYKPKVYPIDYYQGTNISLISRDRMRYVGSNKYLRNIIYASLGPDLHLYLNSSNPQFMYLKKLRMTGVFEDFESVSDLLCDGDGSLSSCDPMESEFPIREHLVPTLIELVVKELVGAEYRPEDTRNDANDDLNKLGTRG